MSEFADLEIALRRRDAESYEVEFRFNAPESDAEVRLIQHGVGAVRFDLAKLHSLELDAKTYGMALAEALLGDTAVSTAFAQARSVAQSQDATLRVRLFLEPNASDLQSLRWETLRDPVADEALFSGEQIVFSRYLSSSDWLRVQLRARYDLRALVAIANPANLSEYAPGGRPLAAVDVDGELARVKDAMASVALTTLASTGSATLSKITSSLRDGFDILYIVCHGAVIQGEPRLWLEDENGKVAVISASELVQRIKELKERPRLIVLASCQSAGAGKDTATTDSGALAALGPMLAEAGVPAVLAMQGDITMETVARFMPVFFRELLRDGQIDRATSVARGSVRDRTDHWVPVLFMRLRSGRIWYVPGFGDPKTFKKWPAILDSIDRGSCTPILGAGLVEGLFGATRDIAQRWADQFRYPMAAHNREDLPSVAQFLAVNQSWDFVRSTLEKNLRQELMRRHPEDFTADLQNASLDAQIAAVGAKLRQRNPADPHRVLASKPFPIYVTTNPDSLLEDALVEAGRTPRSDFCRWNSDLEGLPPLDPKYYPDAQNPLVYHLYGQTSEPASLVLTEDNYFDYLIGATRNKDLIPVCVRSALAATALLFLGFRLDDWNFRVLFRSIMSQEGASKHKKHVHVAAQIEPEEGRILEPERAREYLESYFQDSQISIYWGSVDDFVTGLLRQPLVAVA